MNVELGVGLQLQLRNDEGYGWAVSGCFEVLQPEFSHIEPSEAGLPQHANEQTISDQQ